MIKTGKFKAKDLRLRFELGNYFFKDAVQLPATAETPFSLNLDDLVMNLHLFKANLDDFKGYWEKGSDKTKSWIDFVLYAGAEKEFDFNTMKTMITAFTFSIHKKNEAVVLPIPQFTLKDKILEAQWKDLKLKVATDIQMQPKHVGWF